MNTSTFASTISFYDLMTQSIQRITIDDAFAKYGRTPTCMYVCEIDRVNSIHAAKAVVETMTKKIDSKCVIA